MNSFFATAELCDSLTPEQQSDVLGELIRRKREANSIAVFGALFAANLRACGYPALADRVHVIAELATTPDIRDHDIEPKTVAEPTPKHFRNAAAGTNDNRAAAWLILAAKELEAARTPAGS